MPHRKLIAVVKQAAFKLKEAIPHKDASAADALDLFHEAIGRIDTVFDHLKKNQDHAIKQVERSHHYRNNELQKAQALRNAAMRLEDSAMDRHEEVVSAANARQIKLANERRKLENARAALTAILGE